MSKFKDIVPNLRVVPYLFIKLHHLLLRFYKKPYNNDMQDSLFMKIIKGEIPAQKIYEDDKTLAFLDIHPKQPGHTLVVPKVQVEQLWDLDPEYYQAVMEACRKVAFRLREVLKPLRIGVQVEGLDINHAHVHLIPFNTSVEFFSHPDFNAPADNQTLDAMAKKLSMIGGNTP